MASASLNKAIAVSPEMSEELDSCFCQAVEYNYERALQAILTKVKDPSAVVNKDYSVQSGHPILLACEKGYVRIVEILLKNGGVKCLEKHNKHKCNCLHAACRAGNFELVQLLCEHASTDPSERTRKIMVNLKSKHGWTPLMFAIQAKQVDIVSYLLKIPDITLDSLTKNRQNIAHIAAQYSLDCLKALQSSSHVPSSLFLATDKKGWSILHRACAGDKIETLKWILELRTTSDDSNGVLAPNNEGYSGDLPLLFEGKLNERAKNGYTPLLVACEYQHKDMVEYLLSFPGVDASVSTSMEGNERGHTGLHIAASLDSPEIAKLLIDRGCPTVAINEEGDTALHIARRKSSFEVFDILKNLMDDGLQDVRNKDGKRADEIEPEEVIPPEIQKRGPKAVHAFCKALREGKQTLFPQCKLLVLGEARVGKTSLVRHIIGQKFISDLNPTRGIENEQIATMIDTAHIEVNNWQTISNAEQAERNQEHCRRAIVDIMKEVDPTILETETENNPQSNPENVKTEPQIKINESYLLSKICKLLAKPVLIELPKRKKTNCSTQQHRNDEYKRDPILNFEKDGEQSISNSLSVSFEMAPPSKRQRTGTKDQSIGHPLPTPMPRGKKQQTKGTSIAPEAMYASNAAPNEPQTQPITAAVQKSGLGRRRVQHLCKKLLTTPQKTQDVSLCLEILDFAGQKMYRPMHHCFMSRRAIYIIAFNLQHLLDPKEKTNTFGELKYWLNSIHAHVHIPKNSYKYEKYIFLVGTHKNPGDGSHVFTDDDLKGFSNELHHYLFNGYCHFKNGIHFFSKTGLIMTGLENSTDQYNSGIEVITNEIEQFSKYLPFVSEVYPINWLSFRNKLLKRKILAGSLLLKLDEAEEIAKDCGVKDHSDVHTALVLFHDTGMIIYPAVLNSIFLEESEKHRISDMILMEPKWLISIMTKVMEVPISHPTLSNTDIENLMKTGMANRDVLYQLWQEDHKGDENQFQIICLLMRAHGLMQVIKPAVSNDIQFMIPCLLCHDELKFPNGYIFYFDFKGFLPQEVFHCLICLVIKKCQEILGCSPPKFSSNACVWYNFKGYDWYIQPMSQEHRLKVVVRPRGRKKPDLPPLQCISFFHKEYIYPICELSGLPGLTYMAGPMVETCRMADPPRHSAGVLAAVCYPCSDSNGSEKSGKCPTCCEEYDIEEVLHQSYPDILQENCTTLMDSIQDKDVLAGRSYMKDVTVCTKDEGGHSSKENRPLTEPVQKIPDALKMAECSDTIASQVAAGMSDVASIKDMKSDRRQSGGGDSFENVSGDLLGEDDLVDVMEEVINVAPKWKHFGLALRIKFAELDTISSKNHTDPTECLRDVLLAWLQQHYDAKKFGLPSWRMLCQAISKAAGGNNPALARKITDRHLLCQ